MSEVVEATLQDDVEQQDPQSDGASNSDAAANQPDEPFLRVNDRQVYKTREDATRAYQESGQRIAQLSAWEKEAKGYGISDPKVMRAIFDETLSLREKVKALESAQAKPSAQPTHSDEKLTPEEQKAQDYLKSVLPKLGYVPKSELESVAAEIKTLKEELSGLRGQGEQSREQHFSRQEKDAQADLNSWIDADYGQGSERGPLMGTLIKEWINADEDRIARWVEGGRVATDLVKEGYETFKAAVGWTKSIAPNANASVTAAKGKAVAQNKKLPQSGTAAGEDKGKTAAQRRSVTQTREHTNELAKKLLASMEA